MPITQDVSFNADVPVRGEAPAVFATKANAAWVELKRVFDEDLHNFSTQANALETNVNTKEQSVVVASNLAQQAALNAQASANFQGMWTSKGYTVGQCVLGSNNVFYVCTTDHTVAQNPTSTSGYWVVNVPLGAIGNINSPLLDMPLKNSLAMKSGVGSATFTRASTATYIDRYGVLKTAAIDEPRFEKEGYLNEGSSTNLLTYSEDFSNDAWVKESSTLTANTAETLDPYGTNLADKIMETAVTSNHALYTQYSTPFTVGVAYSQSWFIKPNGRTKFRFETWTGAAFTTNRTILIDLVAKTSTVLSGTVLSHGIIELANGWFRVWLSYTADATGAQFGAMRPVLDDGVTAYYLGDVTKGFYIFGAQLEALPFASSYIPTVASTVTRSADVLSVTYNNNTAGYTNRFSEETLAVDYRKFANNDFGVLFTAELNNSSYRFYVGTSNVVGQYGSDSVGGSQLTSPTVQNYVKNRFILTHNIAGVTEMYTNGVLSATGTSGTSNSTGTPTALWIGSNGGYYHAFGHITDFRIYNKSLTSQEAALA